MKHSLVALLAVALALPAAAQAPSEDNLIVVHNVNLRRDPSTGAPPIRLLKPPDELDLLEPNLQNDYYHVRTSDGAEEGWVWSHNVRKLAQEEHPPISPEAASGAHVAAVAAAVATSVLTSWDKPAPTVGNFSSHGATCGPTGTGPDKETNRRKNRTDVPASYHDVSFDAIAGLQYPVAGKHRNSWTQAQLDEIAPFEGAALRMVGYLVAIKPQTGGSGESTNCNWTAAAEVDWHVAVVNSPGDGEKEAVVVETTPRLRKNHLKWKKSALEPWLNSDAPVRISGWLMLDPEHRNHLKKYRSTLWEIHPITKIEVWKDDTWVDLDTLPPL
jgi:hypothetical protein